MLNSLWATAHARPAESHLLTVVYQIGLVSQEPLLFSCSVLDNIRYGRPDASMEEVVEAARAANVHDLIEGLPDKYDTQVGCDVPRTTQQGTGRTVAVCAAMWEGTLCGCNARLGWCTECPACGEGAPVSAYAPPAGHRW